MKALSLNRHTYNPLTMNPNRLVNVVYNWIGGGACLWLAGLFTPTFGGVFTSFMQYAIPIAGFLLSIISMVAGITTIMKNIKEGKLWDSLPKFLRKRRKSSNLADEQDTKPTQEGTI